MIAIPAIDLMDGKVVRLYKGRFDEVTTYSDDPFETAKRLIGMGARRIHVVDLDAARQSAAINERIIKSLANVIGNEAHTQVGGGIHTLEKAETLLGAGVSNVVIGSLLFDDYTLFRDMVSRFGDRIILALDVKSGTIRTHGWRKDTGVTIDEIVKSDWIREIHAVMVTDISVDGAMTGPNFDLMQRLNSMYPLKWIASGGVGSKDDLARLIQTGVYGAIVGKAIYEGKITDLNKLEVTI